MPGCNDCPRQCGANRERQSGFCGTDNTPRVARAALHFWEEPAISGTRGSGAVFFSGCNMRCVFCQNMQISAAAFGEPCSSEKLCGLFLGLQAKGAHNINLVTPTPHLATLRTALTLAKQRGLNIPVVYNTNAYERLEALQSLAGLVDIYLPDIKYVSAVYGKRFSDTPDYFAFAAPAILEMQRQAGSLRVDELGIAKSGLILRHLVLPGCLQDTRDVLHFIREQLPADVQISLMRQYTPAAPALPPPLDRRLTVREYERAIQYCMDIGLRNVWIQEEGAAEKRFTPPFFTSLMNL